MGYGRFAPNNRPKKGEEYEKTGNLKIHWAHRVMGGDRTGDLHATVYQKGKRSARKCLGILDCENPDCEVTVRPRVRPEAIDKQMIIGCPKCHVVAVGQEAAFESRTLALLDAPNHEGFLERAGVIIRDFPVAGPWLRWWMNPGRAIMLFSSEKTMSTQLWTSLPSTTNAEESMHWKIYSAVGRDHGILEGFLSLLRVSEYYKRLYDAVQCAYNISCFSKH